MGLTSVHPKRGNSYLHKAIDDLVMEGIEDVKYKLKIDRLLPLYFSYRTNIKEKRENSFR
jgi:hypothetical protein